MYQEVDLTARSPGGDVEYEWKGVRPYKGRFWAYSRANMEQLEKEGRLIYRKTGMPRLKVYLGEMPGAPAQSLWDDIEPAKGRERLGYDTQKPLALLERCHSGVIQRRGRGAGPFLRMRHGSAGGPQAGPSWIGIDVTNLAMTVMKKRLEDAFRGIQYRVVGEPTTYSRRVRWRSKDPTDGGSSNGGP